jgi:hypothetical protein
MAAEALEFDAPSHTYRLAGRIVPSVTQILGIVTDFDGIPPAVLENARRRGEAVHKMIDLDNREELDETSVTDELAPFLKAWRKFLAESGAVVISSELRVYHEKLGYAGTADLLLDWNGRYVLPDIKATYAVPRTVGIQTAAYGEAYWQMHGGRGRRPERACIHLKDGDYKVHWRREPTDLSIFISCLNVFRFLQEAA